MLKILNSFYEGQKEFIEEKIEKNYWSAGSPISALVRKRKEQSSSLLKKRTNRITWKKNWWLGLSTSKARIIVQRREWSLQNSFAHRRSCFVCSMRADPCSIFLTFRVTYGNIIIGFRTKLKNQKLIHKLIRTLSIKKPRKQTETFIYSKDGIDCIGHDNLNLSTFLNEGIHRIWFLLKRYGRRFSSPFIFSGIKICCSAILLHWKVPLRLSVWAETGIQCIWLREPRKMIEKLW